MEDMKISVMHKNELSTEIMIQSNRVTVQYYTDDPFKRLIPDIPMDLYKLVEILKGRCFEEQREDIQELLGYMGLKNYNVIEMCRYTHGRRRDDYIWLKFDDEQIDYEDIKLRD